MKYVFRGADYRVQVTVYDWTGTKWEAEMTRFSVKVLRATDHPSKTFSKGHLAYFGDDLIRAWAEVQRHTPGEPLPAGLRKFVK